MFRDQSGIVPAGVTVVTVTFNSAHAIELLLQSVPVETPVIVVDNASSDASVELAQRWPNVTVHRMARNVGFGAACNMGARLAATEHLFFVNPDAELEIETIPVLSESASCLPGRSALNPQFLDESGETSLRSPSRFLGRRTGARAAAPSCDQTIDVLHGAALFLRREHFLELGGFDEHIFLYFEDDDLSLRLLDAGFILRHIHGAVVHHKGGASTPNSPDMLRFKNYHWQRSSAYLAHKRGVPFRALSVGGKLAYRWALSAMRRRPSDRYKYEGRMKAVYQLLREGPESFSADDRPLLTAGHHL